MAAVTATGSATSTATATPPTSPATASAASRRRSRTATDAPAAANRAHVARPIPDPPPVTIAFRPSIVPTARILAYAYARPVMDADDARQHLISEQERLERLQAGFAA